MGELPTDNQNPIEPTREPENTAIPDDTKIQAELRKLETLSDRRVEAKRKRLLKLAPSTRRFGDLEEAKRLAQELEAVDLERFIDQLIQFRERNGRTIEAVGRGDSFFSHGMLVRDQEGQLAHILDYRMVADNSRYGRDDSSIRRPQKLANPVIRIEYADGHQAEIDVTTPLDAVYNRPVKVQEDDPFYDYAHLEERGHDFQLGELVSFGDQIGALAAIYPDERMVEISARVIWGQDTARYLYQTSVDQIDYIVRDNGDIKKNPDGTIFKPSLGSNQEMDQGA